MHKMLQVWTTVSTFTILILSCVVCLDNGLARIPPMGWNSWHAFGCQRDCRNNPKSCLREDAIKRTVDELVSDGWKDLGYKYVIIDACWSDDKRDAKTNKPMADPSRFKSGMKELGKYIHSKGLLFGLTIPQATETCDLYPASMHFHDLDAKTMAEWEVDFVKMNNCNSSQQTVAEGFQNFSRLLNETGRQIVFLCNYLTYDQWISDPHLIDWTRLQNSCNLFRLPVDVAPSWKYLFGIIDAYQVRNDKLIQVSGPGHWSDSDMLILGYSKLSNDEKRVQMGMWCMFAAPLIISSKMENLDLFSKSLLRNKQLLAIDQDKGGHQAKFVKLQNYVQLWIRKLDESPVGWAIAYVNTKVYGKPINFVSTIEQFNSSTYMIFGDKFELMDVFTGESVGTFAPTENFTVSINSTGIMMYRVQPIT